LDASSVQTAPGGSRRIVWMIIGIIKEHPTKNRMPRRARECRGHLLRWARYAKSLIRQLVRKVGLGRWREPIPDGGEDG
jgi:hypothetical protein